MLAPTCASIVSISLRPPPFLGISSADRDDPHPREERFVTLRTDALGRLLVVCWSSRDDDFRIISARRANRAETLQYEQDS
jgi:uncharacterized DUF497 family protein